MPRLAECDVVGPRSFHPHMLKNQWKIKSPISFSSCYNQRHYGPLLGLFLTRKDMVPPQMKKKKKKRARKYTKIGNWAYFSNNIISRHDFKIIFFTNISSLRDSILGYKSSLLSVGFHVLIKFEVAVCPPENRVLETRFIVSTLKESICSLKHSDWKDEISASVGVQNTNIDPLVQNIQPNPPPTTT